MAVNHKDPTGEPMYCRNPEEISDEQLAAIHKKFDGMMKESERFNAGRDRRWHKRPAG
ncbi:hypothetical protein [Gorillibacterium sp. sgz5001074]|uniref:hypothetical protein n=1 Tax=Gorillibacterium sp. sgz5001074 TaxID=3446695 RepID=UPI003F668FB5